VLLPDFGDRLNLKFIRSARGRWLVGSLVAAIAACLCVALLVPSFAESKARERLASLGLEWTAQGSHVGFSGLRFSQVEIKRAGSDRAMLRAEQLAIDLAWTRALWNPRGAVENVHVLGAKLDLSAEDVQQLRKRRGAGRSDGAKPAPALLPSIQMDRGELLVRDPGGTLAAGELESATFSAQGWRAKLRSFELGSDPGDVVSLETVQAEGPVLEGRPVVAQASVGSATLRWRTPGQRDEAGDEPSAGLIRRVRSFRKALRPAPDDRDAADDEPEKSARLWTADAKLSLRDVRVIDATVSPPERILERLNAELLAQGEDALRVKGEGATASGGSMLWDLQIKPAVAEVEGRVALREVPLALFAPVLPRLPFYRLESTRVAADLAITGHGLESASVRGELSIRDLAMESERLARAPVGPISFTARGQATWTPARRELSDLRGEVESGAARVAITGALAWPTDGYRVDFKAEMPKVKCDAVREVVPSGLLDELSDIALKGDVKAKVEVHVDSADLDATKLDFDIDDKCKFVELPELMNVQRFARPFVHRVLEPDGSMFEMETGPGTAAWTPIELISPFMIQGVIAHEDGRFFNHRGFAETEIGAALARNLKAHAFKFGASTITMQLVKNVFLHRDKLLSRKVQEALIVWWLEQHVDKKWILELYLNVIEYGTSIYGIRNAALHYFGTLPIHLTPAQAAFLATILPSPKAYDEQYAKGAMSESTKSRVGKFLQHMRSRDRIDEEALAFGLEELATFRFYKPDQPPPAPPPTRGAALALPFQLGPVENWNTYQPGPKVETGSFGTGFSTGF
jgi:hypothetical protein